MIPVATPRPELVRQLLEAEFGLVAWRQRQALSKPLDGLLSFCAQTVPYYRESLAPATNGGSLSLSSFPPLTKREIVSRYDEYISTAVDRSELKFTSTSGTTGAPLRVGRDLAAWYAVGYDFYRFSAAFLPPFADAIVGGDTGVVMLNDNPIRAPWSVLNPSLGYSLIHKLILGRTEREDEEIAASLRGETIPMLYGRPRTLLRLAELDESLLPAPRQIRPKCVLSSGDRLHDDQRQRLESWYQCEVYNAFATVEGGFVGMECPHRCGIHVWAERAVLEVLDAGGAIGPCGEGELLLTNLTNWAMPFIRYRTGDALTIQHGECRCGHSGQTITHLAGRESTVFVICGRRVPPTYLNGVFEDLPVRQFQVVQEGPSSLRVHWIPREDCGERRTVEESILAGLRQRLGPVTVEILAVESLGTPWQKVPRFTVEAPQ